MGKGHESFREFVNSYYLNFNFIPNCTNLEFLIEAGIPNTLLSEKTGISIKELIKHSKEFPIEERAIKRKKVIENWYNSQFNSLNDKGIVELKDYLNLYDTLAIMKFYPEICDGLLNLSQNGYTLPFIPNGDFSYLFGSNLGNGSISEFYDLYFTGNRKHQDLIKKLIRVPPVRDTEKELLFSKYLGRLFYLSGMPKGSRQEAELHIPKWIKDVSENRRGFLAGIIDTISFKGEREFSVRTFVNKDKKIYLHGFIKDMADLFQEEGIRLTDKKYSILDEDKSCKGIIYLGHKAEDFAQLKRALPMQSYV